MSVAKCSGMLTELSDALLSVLFAPACAACRETLERPRAGPVCARCWSAIQPITPPVCEACGDPLASARSAAVIAVGADLDVGPRCARCRDSSRVVDRARAAGAYEGSLRDILHAFKYDGRRSLARPLGRLMRAAGEEILRDADYLVPVPLHRRRRRERGFNQATDLGVTLGLPIIHALRRVRATAPQADLTAVERQRNVRGAFALRGAFSGGRVFTWVTLPQRRRGASAENNPVEQAVGRRLEKRLEGAESGMGCPGPHAYDDKSLERRFSGLTPGPPTRGFVRVGVGIRVFRSGWFASAHGGTATASDRPLEGLCLVLVDDVSTTGATLDACARVLKAAGAREVRALTVARAVARQP